MKSARNTVFCALLLALIGLPGCRLGLFEVVKSEVEAYKLEQAGSPGISVLKGIDEVPEGGEMPIGPGIAGQTKLVTFSIENPGTASLQLTGSPRVLIEGMHAAQFSINTLPASVIAPGGKSDFIIDFSPVGTGERTATLLIENNASGDGSFAFSIVGEGVGSAGPEIQVIAGSTVIDESPGYIHDFGKRFSGQTATASFTIYNIGTPSSLLQLLGYPNSVTISGADAAMFSVSVQPEREWLLQGDAAQDHASFQLSYQPTAMGTHTATVSILNNDANGDEVIYTFALTGICDRLEVLFLVGVNGAMAYAMPSVKAGIPDTMLALSALDPNVAFALSTFCDFPYGSWGGGTDKPYDFLQGLTTSQASILTPLNALNPWAGNDPPASQLEALYQATTGEGLSISDPIIYDIPANLAGWRTNSLKAIVLITDFAFHNPETEYYVGHTFGQTIDAMNAAQVKMIGLNVGYMQSEPDLQIIAASTGGVVFSGTYYDSGMVMAGIESLLSQY
jgi:hypothetical protein